MEQTLNMNRYMKKKESPMQRLYAVVFFICFFIYSVSTVSQDDSKNVYRIYIDGEKKETKNEIIRKDDQNYISLYDIRKIFDTDIQYEESTKTVVTTKGKYVAAYKKGEEKYLINGQEKETKNPLIEQHGEIHVALEALSQPYNMEIKKSNNRIVLLDKNKKLEIAKLGREEKLKTMPTFLAGSTEKIRKGESLIIIENKSPYMKVITEKLKIGYITKDSVETISIQREEQKKYEMGDIHIIENYDNPKLNFDKVIKSDKKKNIALVSNYILKADGQVEVRYEKENKSLIVYLEKLKQENIEDYANIEIKKGEEFEFEKMLAKFETRAKMAENIVTILKKYGHKGINITIPGIKDEAGYTKFITELKPRIEEIDKKIIMSKESSYNDIILRKVDKTY